MKKVAVITCYFDPDYIRARTIRLGLLADTRIQTIIIKNRLRSILRYPEIIWKLMLVRFRQRPDIYVLTFRGQELLPFVLLLAWGKPVIFDEFIIPIAYATNEPHAQSLSMNIKHFLARISEPIYKIWLRSCRYILADTQAHAELSARTSHVNLRQYVVIPVGTDEQLFRPSGRSKSEAIVAPFVVFFYGNMLPLHGLPVVLEAARLLVKQKDIKFHIIGGNKTAAHMIEQTKQAGVRLTYEPWLPFEDLPAAMHQAALTLSGPFGNTMQAQHVITGKTYQFLACAVPTVVGQNDATDRYFEDKQSAIIVPQGDAEALAKAVEWAAQHRSKLVDIGREGRELYERQFSQQVIAATLASLMNELV